MDRQFELAETGVKLAPKTESARVLYYDQSQWQTSHVEPGQAIEKPASSSLRVVFATSTPFSRSTSLRSRFKEVYRLPVDLWDGTLFKANGFVGSYAVGGLDEKNPADATVTWFRFILKQLDPTRTAGGVQQQMYEWYEMSFLVYDGGSGAGTVYCLDCPPVFERSLQDELWGLDSEPSLADVRCALVHQIVRLYDGAVWAIRDIVRRIERERLMQKTSEPDFAQLHDLARHAIHSTEVLEVAVSTLTHLTELKQPTSSKISIECHPSTESSPSERLIRFYLTLLQNFHHRSQAVESRIHNEINLAFNLVAQRDSMASMRINEAAKEDSSAMRKISIVTLAFLPPTFVSTIFSMSFFNFSPNTSPSKGGDWAVSPNFWMYWAIAVPLTLLIMGWWVLGQKRDFAGWRMWKIRRLRKLNRAQC